MAILNVLANCPGGRATLDEVRRAVRATFASGDQTEQLEHFSALGEIDIFQSGLVSQDDAGLQITDAGLALLRSLESSSESSLKFSSAPALRPLDNFSSMEERLRTFDLEPRTPGNDAQNGDYNNPHRSAQDEERRTVIIETPDPASKIGAFHPSISANSKSRERGWKSLELASLIAFMAAKQQAIFDLGLRYFARTTSFASNRGNERSFQGGAVLALLSLVAVVTCVIAAIALGQIQSLKSDISSLRRELLPVKERVTRLERAEKEKRDLGQQDEGQNRPSVEKNQSSGEIRPDQTALNLSREEIHLIREYVKPAPVAGGAVATINVGDPVEGAMIPLPSQLTDKLPKLLGGKFTISNGTIIIVKRDSRQADAVLAPN